MEGRRTDRHTDVQRETIIPHHYCVAGYKNLTIVHFCLKLPNPLPKILHPAGTPIRCHVLWHLILVYTVCSGLSVTILRVCLFVLWPSQPNWVMLRVVSLPNHIFTGQAWSSKMLTSNVCILQPEIDKCPS